ncbi:hypothetical protein H0H93_012974 [Arthromyces matolae]|nr:hypothetical protein H0H93_012974 [Arthromyces matolae]
MDSVLAFFKDVRAIASFRNDDKPKQRSHSDDTIKQRSRLGDTTSLDSPLENQTSDLIIVVMGATGSGKSTFINLFFDHEEAPVGKRLGSHTQKVNAYALPVDRGYQSRIVLVDTPGFDDSKGDDWEILKQISGWLAHSYRADTKVAGVIYCQNMLHNRWSGASDRSFQMFQKICGPAAARKIVLMTTMWGMMTDDHILEEREQELKAAYWKSMIKRGSVVRRSRLSRDAALDTLDYILMKNAYYPLLHQNEIVELGMSLSQTQAGRGLLESYQKLIGEHKREATKLREEGGSTQEVEEIEARMRKAGEALKEARGDLRIPRLWRVLFLKFEL